MSTYTSTEWTCDRCGATVKVGAHERPAEQPLGWGALLLIRPPLMAPADSDQRPDQVCTACIDAYFDWWSSATKVES